MRIAKPGPMPLDEYRRLVARRMADKFGVTAHTQDLLLEMYAEELRCRWIVGETPTLAASDLVVAAQRAGVQ